MIRPIIVDESLDLIVLGDYRDGTITKIITNSTTRLNQVLNIYISFSIDPSAKEKALYLKDLINDVELVERNINIKKYYDSL